MFTFLSVLAVLGFMLYAGRSLKPAGQRLLQIGERYVQLAEKEAERPSMQKAEPMPPDLIQVCYSYDDQWARDEVMDRAYELYSKLQSWDRVRMALVASDSVYSLVQVKDN